MKPEHDRRRRLATQLLFATLAGATFAQPALAQSFPAKPIRLLVGYAPGGNADILARILAEDMGPRLGQPVIVDNRAGASGSIAQAALKASAPDGYTIELFTTPTLIAALVGKKKITTEDLTPIGMVYETHVPILVSTSAPLMANVRTLKDLVAVAKANPGKVNYSTAARASTGHLFGERFASATGIEWTHVSYKGLSPAVFDLVAGRLDVLIGTADQQFIKDGKLRAVAVTGPERRAGYDAPTLVEAGFPDLSLSAWAGLAGPPGLPKAIADRIAAELKVSLDNPVIAAKLNAITPGFRFGPASAMQNRLASDNRVFPELIVRAGITPD